MLDKETLTWLFRLTIIGTILIALFSVFDTTPFIIRAIGNLFVLGGLLFLIDVEGGTKFKRTYWSVLVIWFVVVCHSGIAFITKSEQINELFKTITFFIYAIVLLSIPLFTHTMRILSAVANVSEIEMYWKKLTRFSFIYYILPIIAFLGAFVGQAMGGEVQLYFGVEKTSNIPLEFVKYSLRLLFFTPPLLIIIKLHKIRHTYFSTLPYDQIPKIEETTTVK